MGTPRVEPHLLNIIDQAVNGNKMTDNQAKRAILDALPWMDEAIFSHLWSQGQYYARR